MNLTASDIRHCLRNASSIFGLMVSQGKLQTGCGYPGSSGKRIASTRSDVSKIARRWPNRQGRVLDYQLSRRSNKGISRRMFRRRLGLIARQGWSIRAIQFAGVLM